mmetsp:Transcript_22455/g.58562  ORF Transcript_22455/g.58562 Transcript_22455/m.58562 type:complete len:125 (-) Transcript_22455:285-659(-)
MKTTPSGLWLCHSLQFATMLATLSNLVQYYFHVCQSRPRWGPALVEFLAMILLLVFPTVVIMRDLGLSPAICEKPLVAASLKACAYTGFLLLLSGAAWATGGFQAAADRVWRGDAAGLPGGHCA